MADKLDMKSMDITQDNIAKIKALFPSAVTEVMGDDGKVKLAIDFDALKQELSEDLISEKAERYQMTWPDKSKAKVLANARISATLRPYKEKSVDFDNTENLYIEGDNLDVLKLLRETYLGKVKMIYIDPPYNTGNDFVYEDDFAMSADNYAEISGQYDNQGNRLVVNTESNGRFHTDWLNMMYPRLKVARDLLTDDGAIFISIDDNEAFNLKKMCDEIFGEPCFVADIAWQRTYSPRNDSQGVSQEKEHIIAYSKSPNWNPQKLPRTEKMDAKYKNPDNDVSPWRTSDAFAPNAVTHQGMVYAIQNPFNGEMVYPYKGACWPLRQSDMLDIMQGWGRYVLKDINDDEQRANVCGISATDVRKEVCAIVLDMPLEEARQNALRVQAAGKWPRFFFTKNGEGGIARKTYLKDTDGRVVTNLWPYAEVGHTDEAKKEVKALFDGTAPFDTPKPTRLIDRILTIATKKDDLVLDFFSGSATTADAVIKKNAEDMGNRKFILIQLNEESKSPDYVDLCEIGQERIRRAGKKIKKDGGLATQDLDIGFRVLKLDSSNMQEVYYNPSAMTQDILAMTVDNVKTDRTPLDLLFQVMLDLGIELSAKIEENVVNGKTYYAVNGNDIIACFDDDIDNDVITAIAKQNPLYAVFKDKSFATDSVGINNEQLFKTYSPSTVVKVI